MSYGNPLVFVLNQEGVEHATNMACAFEAFKRTLETNTPFNDHELHSIFERLERVRDHAISKLGKYKVEFPSVESYVNKGETFLGMRIQRGSCNDC